MKIEILGNTYETEKITEIILDKENPKPEVK